MTGTVPQKLEWLKDLIGKLIKMSEYYNKSASTSMYQDSYTIGGMLDNIELGKLPQKRHLIKCNEILKELKRLYKFDIDWRGDIINCDKYTKYIIIKEETFHDKKINIIYSWDL